MSSHGPVPSSSSKVWIDPALLPSDLETDIASVAGNAPDGVKQLVVNTFYAYGVGTCPDTFGYRVGRATRWVDMSVSAAERQASVKKGKQRMEAVTVAEVTVSKDMLNGAGMLHGGCLTYLIDNCASTPLIVLGLLSGMNGVGVTQSMNVLFHAPAPLGTRLRITSSTIALGGRVMTARCEITDDRSGRVVASAFLNKMQPQTTQSKL